MIDLEEHPWPLKGDRFFISDGTWRDTAVLNAKRDNLSLYAVGYKLAGDSLVKHVIANQRDHDSHVFPIAFAYRQYLELRLKQLIRDGYRFLSKPYPSQWHSYGFPVKHEIDILWKICKPILEQIAPKVLTEEEPKRIYQALEAIEALIIEFAQYDAASVAFRYPLDNKNHGTLLNVSHINLQHLAAEMGKVANFLEKVYWPISTALEPK
jgi:hypothetical protein